ncbi:phosphoribosylformylglycinamidine cyclo-ligase [Poriferisphaera sp. WC338]|uniref:phosphoribosylformylglycinamidine cyclo-ligase n=1 Tax=Poriferisphaera sp. WC338 TaxID=3425129 RepID=UPI003D81311A
MARKSSTKNGLTYADSGVDIEAGDEVVDRIKGHLRRTYGPRVLGKHGAFAGCFRLDYNEKLFKRNYKDPVLVSGADGVGTKVMLAIELGIYDTVGQDCVAMNVNDMIVQGAEPLFFLDYVGIHKVIPQQMEQIVKGVADGCQLAGCALLGGETAEMADVYKEGDFDLAGFTVGVVELSKVVDGSRVEEGDVILGLASSGVHSNGFSLVRKIIDHAKLDIRKVYPEVDPDRPLGEVLLEPTRIYSKQICSVLRSYSRKKPIGGMAHITGGGLPNNVNRALPSNLDAKISKKAWDVPPLFKFLKKHGNVAPAEMFRVFNMGIGYVLIVRPHFAEAITTKLKRQGETVYNLGEIVPGTGKVLLK